MAICGRQCSVSVDGSANFEGHEWNLTVNAPEIDVTAFGSGEFGSFTSCFKDGTVSIRSYNSSGVEAGDVGDLVLTVGNPAVYTYTCTAALCTSVNVTVTAKDVVQFESSWRITSDVAGM